LLAGALTTRDEYERTEAGIAFVRSAYHVVLAVKDERRRTCRLRWSQILDRCARRDPSPPGIPPRKWRWIMSILLMAPPTHVCVENAKWFWMAFNFEDEQWVSETFIRLDFETQYLKKSYSERATIFQRTNDTLQDGRRLARPFTLADVPIPGGDTPCVLRLFADWCVVVPDASWREMLPFAKPEQQLPIPLFQLLLQQASHEGVHQPPHWDRRACFQLAQGLRAIRYSALAHIVEEHSPKE
jgi:hypothetical protein